MGKKLYVGNLGFDVTDKDLEAVFAQAGVCESVAVITDKFSGQSRGFGFVEMSSNAEAQKAIHSSTARTSKAARSRSTKRAIATTAATEAAGTVADG